MPRYCGGVRLGDTLTLSNGIITMAGETAVVDEIVSPCGAAFDANVFEVVRVGGVPVLTSVGVDEDMDMQIILKTNCGFAVDGNYFTVSEDGELDFDESHVLEVLVDPHDATITVTYGADATPVDPIPGTTNMFKLTETGEEYTVTVSKDGYASQEQDVTADQNHIVEFTLVAN